MYRKKSAAILQRRQMAFKTEKVDADGTFKGYGSVFGNVDSYNEIVAPGAFADSLKMIKASGDPLPVLYQHNADEPIGGYDMLSEDDHGLLAEGYLLINDLPLAKQAHALMQKRILKGLSIGYYVEDSSYNEKTGVRTLNKLDLLEISIVTFPANTSAQIDQVKAALQHGQLPTEREFESFLRERGFSRQQAKEIAMRGYKSLLSRRDDDGGVIEDVDFSEVLSILQSS